MILVAMFFALTASAWAQGKALQLSQTILLPELHDGDFDHFTVDLHGKRLFVAAEENSKVLVFDLRTNNLVHIITDLKRPHACFFVKTRKSFSPLMATCQGAGFITVTPTRRSQP
jgi:hypothetical protein